MRRRKLGDKSLTSDVNILRTLVGVTGGGSGPAPDDAQYLLLTTDSDLTGERVLTPGDGIAGTDAGAGGNYTIAIELAGTSGLSFSAGGLQLDDSIAGEGLSIVSKVLAVNAGDGIEVSADVVAIDLATTSGLSFSSGDLHIDDSIAGDGLSIASKVLAVNIGDGLEIAADTVAVDLATTSGLSFSSGDLQIDDSVAADGLTIASKVG